MPTLLQEKFDRLVSFPPTTFPVLSRYLNAEPNEQGQDDVDRFLRRELAARGRTFEPHSADRESYDKDVEKIQRWVAEELRPSANGVAIFACSGADDFFEAVQLEAPVKDHRIFVFALGGTVGEAQVEGVPTKRIQAGGWSQARYQRRNDNERQQHAKEVVSALDRIVKQEGIGYILLAGDEVAVPAIRAELPQHLEEKVV